MTRRKIIVTGGTGLVGRALVAALSPTYDIRVLSRSAKTPHSIRWDPARGEVDLRELEGAFAVVHLAGENIAALRWTKSKKNRILRSRVDGTRFLVDTLAKLSAKPEVLIASSANGYYGSQRAEMLAETSPPGTGFLSDVCVAWEREAARARDLGVRVVHLRTGLVLSRDGGALPPMLLPFRLGLGGRIGSGKQFVSWIHMADLVRSIQFLLEAPIDGAINAVAPEPVTNNELTRTLATILRRPALLPVPSFALRFALGEMGTTLLLASIRAVPERLLSEGFQFHYPTLEHALRGLLSRGTR
ncbi:MAG: TIGR01777 family oxidoreductase [Deltaproteobacteria bacterium]|nr:TIGR01777 family oxidoreductase [Deltaproteobacteria bacterium]